MLQAVLSYLYLVLRINRRRKVPLNLAAIETEPIPSEIRGGTLILLTRVVHLLKVNLVIAGVLSGVQLEDAVAHVVDLEAPVVSRVLGAALAAAPSSAPTAWSRTPSPRRW